ncbi:SGNH/GDSL hydrolase family protein [Paenibacillus sp. Soil787]|uniref:SGNH/GDSL hydrolase family protein n=1 Tax=Paenibacillus sp. Soil787 TaxID=1736411 RepID=UPI0006F72980|nr:SGNH/GDSL hydrolase family protein [Paenibacillus sp. Soil787]KRF41898.1 GDSL family lipase [Paenibacillus sp. Soil787]
MWSSYASATALSTANNFIMKSDSVFMHTYRAYIKTAECGKLELKFWCSNLVDSTWADGSESRANLPGGLWKIEAAYIADGGKLPGGSVVEGTQIPVTFDSSMSRMVLPGETFWSDATEITIPEEHYLVFSWTIMTLAAGDSFPYNTEAPLVPAYDAPGHAAGQTSADGFRISANCLVLPDFIGCEREGAKRLAFLGDSITQGVRTRPDTYEYWVARIAEGLAPAHSVWNIGSGWARAYDAASDGAWLHKAKHNDEVVVALGVNDIGMAGRSAPQVLEDLQTIVAKLKGSRIGMSVILCTVPTFNFSGSQELAWRQVNQAIRSHDIAGVDRVFDIAKVLSQAAPCDNLLMPEYMSEGDDPHPNGKASSAIAAAFLSWY